MLTWNASTGTCLPRNVRCSAATGLSILTSGNLNCNMLPKSIAAGSCRRKMIPYLSPKACMCASFTVAMFPLSVDKEISYSILYHCMATAPIVLTQYCVQTASCHQPCRVFLRLSTRHALVLPFNAHNIIFYCDDYSPWGSTARAGMIGSPPTGLPCRPS